MKRGKASNVARSYKHNRAKSQTFAQQDGEYYGQHGANPSLPRAQVVGHKTQQQPTHRTPTWAQKALRGLNCRF